MPDDADEREQPHEAYEADYDTAGQEALKLQFPPQEVLHRIKAIYDQSDQKRQIVRWSTNMVRLELFNIVVDTVLEGMQKLLTGLMIVCAGCLLWGTFFCGDATRLTIFQFISQLPAPSSQLSGSWKILVIGLAFVFRHDISSLLARLKILGKDGAHFDQPTTPTSSRFEPKPAPAPPSNEPKPDSVPPSRAD